MDFMITLVPAIDGSEVDGRLRGKVVRCREYVNRLWLHTLSMNLIERCMRSIMIRDERRYSLQPVCGTGSRD